MDTHRKPILFISKDYIAVVCEITIGNLMNIVTCDLRQNIIFAKSHIPNG